MKKVKEEYRAMYRKTLTDDVARDRSGHYERDW
jgi:hypothetical protein